VAVENINDSYSGGHDEITAKLNGKTYTLQIAHNNGSNKASEDTKTALNEIVGGSPKDGWFAVYNEIPYMYYDKEWYSFYHDNKDENGELNENKTFAKDYLNKLRGFKTGGLADFTGPAWLDGTPSRPEYILNAQQTERFFSLIDVLESFNKNDPTSTKSGDNYFDINIQVDKLENDYDVEQMADKIRQMIYEDATYRNVNAINHIR
jgi:hypothetical protein